MVNESGRFESLERAERRMMRLMRDVILKNKIKSDELLNRLGVE